MSLEEWADPDLRDYALAGVLRDVHAASSELTESEKMALRCLAAGLTSEGAGEVLFKAAETIRSQLKSARTKLACKTTTQACCEAIRQGLIP